MNKVEALQIAKDAFSASTTYVDANFRKQWEDALRMFQSKHPADSKYNSPAYQYRSKLFRPKTRSVIRKNEAAIAAAFFSNMDVVNVAASNDKDPKQVEASKLYKELLQYRLTKSIPWFMTLVGGGQDAMTVGVVCSYQHWKYREKVTEERQFHIDQNGVAIMGFDGGPVFETVKKTKVLEDRPAIELLAVENLRIDPGSHWTDPVNTSPYLIHMIPMYLGDLKEMGQQNPKTGEEGWEIPEDGVLISAAKHSYDTTRMVREGDRQDSKENAIPVNDYSIVWVHKNIARKAGEDFCWFTLGSEHMLSRKVAPLSDVYFHGDRPYAMGCAILETHKVYPSGLPELGREVQKEINEVTNSRMDNVKLVMNKRYIVKRGAQVDLKSLVRNVAASVTLANDIEKDVKAIDFTDVTSSSYQEQDRLNVEMDELVGNFSSSSVMTNRKLNETVGGMAMMGQGANQMTEYTIRTLTETWVEPVLRQLVKLEKHYETDENILKLVGDKLEFDVKDEHFDTDVELSVNVGMGATDPLARVNRLLTAGRSIAEIAALNIRGLKMDEFSQEVFGAVGYRDGGRFWDAEAAEGQDPRLQEAQQMIEQLQQELQQAKSTMEVRMAEAETKRELAIANHQLDKQQAQAQYDLQVAEIRRSYDLQVAEARAKIEGMRETNAANIRIAEEKAASQIAIAEKNAETKIAIAEANAEAQRKAMKSKPAKDA